MIVATNAGFVLRGSHDQTALGSGRGLFVTVCAGFSDWQFPMFHRSSQHRWSARCVVRKKMAAKSPWEGKRRQARGWVVVSKRRPTPAGWATAVAARPPSQRDRCRSATAVAAPATPAKRYLRFHVKRKMHKKFTCFPQFAFRPISFCAVASLGLQPKVLGSFSPGISDKSVHRRRCESSSNETDCESI